jgi:uncharacterized membrane protein YcaP (DUF421 family)
MFFDGWHSVERIVLLSAVTYIGLVAALRLIGEQALAKMSAYDLIITVALGSIVASIPLSKDVTLADGAAVVAVYLGLQAVTRWATARWRWAERAVKTQPQIVLWDGTLVTEHMRAAQVTEMEVRAAARMAGYASLAGLLAIVLENDGTWSVVPRTDTADLSAFEGLERPPAAPRSGAPGARLRGKAASEVL